MCTRASPASIPPPDVATFVSLPHDLLCRILAAVPSFDGASCLNAIGLAAKACSALGAAAADEETWRRVAVARCIGVTLRTDSWREAVLGAREAACERLTDASAGVAVCALPIRVASPSRDAPVVSMSSCAAPLGVKQRHFDEVTPLAQTTHPRCRPSQPTLSPAPRASLPGGRAARRVPLRRIHAFLGGGLAAAPASHQRAPAGPGPVSRGSQQQAILARLPARRGAAPHALADGRASCLLLQREARLPRLPRQVRLPSLPACAVPPSATVSATSATFPPPPPPSHPPLASAFSGTSARR